MTGDLLDLLDPHGLAEQADRRAAIAKAVGVVMDSVGRDNTKLAFKADWATWESFCAHTGGTVIPTEVSEDALVLYALWLARGEGTYTDGTPRKPSAPETIRRRITGVLAGWRARGTPPPGRTGAKARQVTDEYHRRLVEADLPTGRGRAPALTVPHARQIAATTPPTISGYRDLALVLIAFAIAGRRDEVAHLLLSDIETEQGGLYVNVRYSKTKPRRPAVLTWQNGATCPVRAWKRWKEASRIIAGTAFRRIDRHGNILGAMSGEAVGAVITRAGRRAGIELHLTGHSARSGLATAARQAGHDVTTIAQQGGWDPNGAALHRYLRIVDQWTDNALAGIGL
ncbi:MAG: tyrosine-type recombinase/integrase [Solirubrobacteraceae bacterium]